MKKTIILLTILLIASNLYWVFNYPDTATTAIKHDDELWERDESLLFLLVLLPKLSTNIKKDDFISISKQLTINDVINKNGCYWYANVGFRFDKKGNLIKASHKLYNFQDDECVF